MFKRVWRTATIGICTVTQCGWVLAAQSADPAARFPNRPIRIVVGFTPGGQPDITARLIAVKLTESLGQQVVIDNRPGAGGTLGSKIVADAAPDGHTLLSVSVNARHPAALPALPIVRDAA